MNRPLLIAGVLGDFWGWVSDVFTRIGDMSYYWLLAALALKTAESALIAVGWRNILRAAYPASPTSFKTAWGASQGGTAINAVAPAQAGTAVMIGIFRTSIKGATVAGVATATAVQAVFFTAMSVLIVIAVGIFRPRTVSKGSPSDETGGFFASHPVVIPVIVVVAIVVLYLLWPRMKPRLMTTWHNLKQGAAIFKDWRRYLRGVALPSAGSYGCRVGVNIVFMAAFGIPVTAFTVFLVASSHMLSGMFAITPGGVGQTQALDVATLRGQAATGSITAFSLTQDAVMTLWNVILGAAVMLWAFGFQQVKDLLRPKRRAARQEVAQEQAPAETGPAA